jgi:hypothetical protein
MPQRVKVSMEIRIVIPNEVRDLQFAANYRSLTSFGMTNTAKEVSR